MTAQIKPLPASSKTTADTERGARVLRLEAEAIGLLADSLATTNAESFAASIAVMDETQGRVIVTGMGKSGHVGRKIAATLASTGRPSYFVHPGEASHGDLGMITAQDSVLALSNSGEAPELGDVLAYCKRNAIRLIAITSRENSTLAQAADILLLLPNVKEACPHNLAPTTSTTLQLALGDALAVALLERRGFSPHDYKNFHPGGKLGRVLLKVSDLMQKGDELPVVAPTTKISDAILVMTNKRAGCVGVVDAGGRLQGLVTDGDLRRHLSPELFSAAVETVMSRTPRTIHADAFAAEAVALMNEWNVGSLCVLDANDALVGLLDLRACSRAGVV